MRARRLITFLLGIWLTGLCGTAFLASKNFETTKQVLESSPQEGRKLIEQLGESSSEQLLRFQVAEANRAMFEGWGALELGLLVSLGLLIVLRHDSKTAIAVAVAALVVSAWSYFLLTPQLISIGRILDFPTPEYHAQYRLQFAGVHRMYGIAGVLRMACGAVLVFLLLRRGDEAKLRRRKSDKVDAINKTDYSHINR